MLHVAGIDYSMTSPAICIHAGDEWSHTNCIIHFLASRKAHLIHTPHLRATEYPDNHKTPEERFCRLSEWAFSVLCMRIDELVLEGYAMGAKGQVFQIAENTSVLKQGLWRAGLKFQTPAPTAIKKFATGRGNAKKEDLEAAFIAETGWDVRAELGQSAKSWNPSSDIIDAYYLAKFAFHNRS